MIVKNIKGLSISLESASGRDIRELTETEENKIYMDVVYDNIKDGQIDLKDEEFDDFIIWKLKL